MTVVSLASGGGGLPDVGAFTDEKVYNSSHKCPTPKKL